MSKKALKLKTLLIILSFIISGKTQLMAENLIETGSWIYLADNVMGGISVGSSEYVTVESGKAIRLYGEVSTKNNGGFIQVRMPYSIDQLEKHKGIKIKLVRKEGLEPSCPKALDPKTNGNQKISYFFLDCSKIFSYSKSRKDSRFCTYLW